MGKRRNIKEILFTIIIGYPFMIIAGGVEPLFVGKWWLVPKGIYLGFMGVTRALYEDIWK